MDQPGNPLRFRIPERTYFQSWYQTGLRGIYENFIGPIEGPNPNTLDL
ncbi:MAG: hypothetical protein ABI156_03870 [Caldimonas sp.]